MIKIKSLKLSNLEDAIYGMRLPLMSHHKSDSEWKDGEYVVGSNDLDLMVARNGHLQSIYNKELQ